jgi:hypothetical protein
MNYQINEMAIVSVNPTETYSIYINGSTLGNTGRSEHGFPHFCLKFKGKTEVGNFLIPTTSEWLKNRKLIQINGEELNKKVIEDIHERMDIIFDFETSKTFLKELQSQWNTMNSNNPKLIRFDENGEYNK